ncbi:MAG: peptidylprolyl isomerase [Planctomycetota bacterium]|jgi:cyclophilin family peptidyl-prolyl cis-trans isomerase
MEGQVDAPNPIELFWEQHKKPILTVIVLILAGVAAFYGKRHYDTVQRNRAAARFAQVTGLNRLITGNAPSRVDQFLRLDDDLAKVNLPDLESYISDEAPGTQYQPWAIWVAAKCYLLQKDLDAAEAKLKELKASFGDHILCTTTTNPPQVREPVEEEGNGKKDKGKDENDPGKEPELKPPVAGSPVDQLLAAIQSNRKFEKEHPGLFAPKEPDGKVVELLLNNTKVTVQLYEQAAPGHITQFLKLVREGFYDGQKVYKIQRDPADSRQEREPQLLHLGLLKTKETDDTAEWDRAAAEPSKTTLDFPTTEEFKKLSFFPGILAVENEKDGKTSGERVFLAANDCAGSMDGDYVILGKVMGGLTDLQALVKDTSFTSGDEAKAGVGKPSEPIEISISVAGEEKKPPPKQPEKNENKDGDKNREKGGGDKNPNKQNGR